MDAQERVLGVRKRIGTGRFLVKVLSATHFCGKIAVIVRIVRLGVMVKYRKNFLLAFQTALDRYVELNFVRESKALGVLFYRNLQENVMGFTESSARAAVLFWKGASTAEISEELDLAEGTVSRKLKEVSDDLYELYGFLLDISTEREMAQALKTMKYSRHPKEYYHMLRPLFGGDEDDAPIKREKGVPPFRGSIDECRREADFLAQYSLGSLEKAIKEEGLSVNKIIRLLDVLQGQAGTIQEQRLVMQVVAGN